jgi:multisubunit Na+/H+ antiporter MnhB subunit
MKRRKQGLISIYAFFMTAVLGGFIALAVTDSGEGRTVNSASLQQRDSFYLIESDIADNISYISGFERPFEIFSLFFALLIVSLGAGAFIFNRNCDLKNIPQDRINLFLISLFDIFVICVGAVLIFNFAGSTGGGFTGGILIAAAIVILNLISKPILAKTTLITADFMLLLAILIFGAVGIFLNNVFLAPIFDIQKWIIVFNIVVAIKICLILTDIFISFYSGVLSGEGE